MYRIVSRRLDPANVDVPSKASAILEGGRELLGPAVPSPDGRWLVTILHDRGQNDILLVDISTGATRRLTNDSVNEDGFAWAPDSSRIYYTAMPQAGPGEIWSLRPDGSGRERVLAIPGEEAFNVGPSPDGKTLYVVRGQTTLCSIDLTSASDRRVPVALPPIDEVRTLGYGAVVSPDGRWIVGHPFSRSTRLYDNSLALFDTQQRSYRTLTKLDGRWSEWVYWWFPNSRSLLLWRRGKERVDVLDRVTGVSRQVGRTEADAQQMALSADGKSLVELRGTYESDIWMLDYGDGAAKKEATAKRP
jgi:hypothetical protein